MTRARDKSMATASNALPTVIEQAEQNPAAAREIAAARLAVNIVWALNEAVRERGWRAKDVAATLGLGESAVSQVLNGDGNLRVATIGRYARSLGYQPRLVLDPVEPGLRTISEPMRRRRGGTWANVDDAVTLPTDGWQVIHTADGAVWGAETTTSDQGPGRLVQETAYTQLSHIHEGDADVARIFAPLGGIA